MAIYKLNNSKHKLQIIATPIGNLNEVSKREIEALLNAKTILCEDTRVTGKLLSNLKIPKKYLINYQNFNENQKLNLALTKIKEGNCILVSDAGYPCISDPGYSLVNECYKNNIFVEIINGPSSIMHSVVVSGLNLNNFYFNGFLNASRYQRKKKLNELKNIKVPIIIFESVHRIKESLNDIYNVLNNPYLVVCRELTKLNETIYRGYYQDIIDEITEKGEFVIVVLQEEKEQKKISDTLLLREVNNLISSEKIKFKEAIKKVANEYGISSSQLYDKYLKTKTN